MTSPGNTTDRAAALPQSAPDPRAEVTDNQQRAAEVIRSYFVASGGEWTEFRELIAAELDAAEARGGALLAEAIVDLCWKATPYGGGETVTAYLLPAGTVHRLIGVAQGVGIPAAFRAISHEGGEPR